MTAYSSHRVRKGLLHFGIGKLGSGAVGVALLMLQVRVMPAEHYSVIVALTASFEILSLVLNAGTLPATWRFLPQARSTGTPADVARVVAASAAGRAAFVVPAAALLLLMPQMLGLLLSSAVIDVSRLASVFAIILVAETLCRHADLVMELLLLQRISQVLILLRNLARLVGLLALSGLGSTPVDAISWASLEAAIGVIGLAAGGFALWKHIFLPARTSSLSGQLPPIRRAFGYAMPAYVAQVLGAFQGLDACKLVISHVAPAPVVAAFGFILSMVATAQRYLPSYLLVGFMRPLFVHAGLNQSGITPSSMASMLWKVNLLLLLPLLVIAALVPDAVTQVLSGGKVAGTSGVLFGAVLVLVLQALHMIFGLLALSAEESLSGMVGTAIGACIFVVGTAFVGIGDAVGVLALAACCEIAWCGVVSQALSKRGVAMTLRDPGYLKLACSAALAAAAGFALGAGVADTAALHRMLWASCAIGSAFLLSSIILKPLNGHERALLEKLIPKRFILF